MIAAPFNVQRYVSTGRLEVMPYSRRDYYKIWVLEGKSVLHYADRSVVVDRPALIFTNPLAPYSFESKAVKRTGYMCIFTEEFLKVGGRMEAGVFKPGSEKVFFLEPEELQMVRRVYEDMLKEMAGEYVYKYDLLRHYVGLLIHLSMKLQPAGAAAPMDAAMRIARDFLELLERQFPVVSPDRELKLRKASDFARELSVHVNHLNHVVKEVTGKSTSVHISERIMNEAKALLKYTDWSVSDIAFCLGFEYTTYFNQFFKKNAGVTPLSLRK